MQRDLVERAMAGEREAFSELVRLSIDRLYAVARLILRDNSRAEDATQEALVAAWRDLSALRDPDRFEQWLHRLLVRTCYREARRERRSVHGQVRELALGASVERQSEPDSTHRIAARDELERGFRRLDTDQRSILVLHFYLGYSIGELAETLAIPDGTAKSRLHRATQAMRSALDADARTAISSGGSAA
jgi:RNA polymerase sigma-70 factor, ECF subfamily